MFSKLKYLSIGHCCHDLVDDGYVLGGTASYASMLAKRLGVDSHILTSYGDDFLFEKEFVDSNIPLNNCKADETTIFKNEYVGGQRTQTILARANTIGVEDLREYNEQFDIAHICPIADEVETNILHKLSNDTITLVTPQGWLRQWDNDGKVSYKEIDWSLLSGVDFVIISDEDVPDLDDQLSLIKASVKNLIVTKGESGSIMYADKVEATFPAYPSVIVDPTGAGDTFATGFIMRYAQTKEIVDSMIYANCLASICIEHQGTTFFEHLHNVEERMDFYKKNMLDLNNDGPMRVK